MGIAITGEPIKLESGLIIENPLNCILWRGYNS
jgi:hypothetical protein